MEPYRILVGVTGSVASVKLEEIIDNLLEFAEVKVVLTKASLTFVSKERIQAKGVECFEDADEWSKPYERGDEVLHIKLRKWANAMLIAPCSANTLAKISHGICDNLLTCVVRAWRWDEDPFIFAPAMNTQMWLHPLTAPQIQTVCSFSRTNKCTWIPPVSKTLACGDIGVGALAAVCTIVDHVKTWQPKKLVEELMKNAPISLKPGAQEQGTQNTNERSEDHVKIEAEVLHAFENLSTCPKEENLVGSDLETNREEYAKGGKESKSSTDRSSSSERKLENSSSDPESTGPRERRDNSSPPEGIRIPIDCNDEQKARLNDSPTNNSGEICSPLGISLTTQEDKNSPGNERSAVGNNFVGEGKPLGVTAGPELCASGVTLMKRGWISVSKPSGEDEKLSPVKEVPPKSPLQTKKEKELKDKTIGKYYKGELLGKGGFGCVFKGINETSGEIFAIKQLFTGKEKEKVNKEIEFLKVLDNPHIVKYYECFEHNDNLHIVLEYVEGGSLYQLIKSFGVFPENLIQVYISQVLVALEFLHSKNIIHRDLKCANVLITKNGICKLADFGTSILSDEAKKRLTMIGTPFWMSPEAIEGEGVCTATDIWSLGCCIIELLTGEPPYWNMGPMGALYKITIENHPPIPDFLSDKLTHFLNCCFQRNPENRFTASQLLTHPWLSSESNPDSQLPITRVRTLSMVEVQEVIETHNERRKTNENLHKYKEFSILGDYDGKSTDQLKSLFLQIKNKSDPVNVLVLLENELKKMQQKMENGMDQQIERENEDNANILDHENDVEILKKKVARLEAKMNFVSIENSALKTLLQETQNEICDILTDKKKLVAIAGKLHEMLEASELRFKNSVVQNQLDCEKLSETSQNPPSTQLLAQQEHNEAAQFVLKNILEPVTAANYVFNSNLTANHIRTNAMENWMNLRSYPAGTKDVNSVKYHRRWMILISGILFAFEAFEAESPTDIILLDRCKITLDESSPIHEKQTNEQRQIQQSVVRWLGNSAERSKKKKKKTQPTTTLLSIFNFTLAQESIIYQLGCDNHSMLHIWLDACKASSPWYLLCNFKNRKQ